MFGKRVLILAAIGLGLAAPAPAVDKTDIDKAIEIGVQALRQQQLKDGSWKHGGMIPGSTALAALTLLECGGKTDDPQVMKAAEYVRASSPTMTKTYSISTSILFLDRLGDPGDVPLIESLTVRLMAGQTADAGWGYDCPEIAQNEIARLQATIKNRTELKSGQLPVGKRTLKDLPQEIQNQVAIINRIQPAASGPGGLALNLSDNSNTQFATLALWIGRRQGLPVENALAKIAFRYRRSQGQDGTWPYLGPPAATGGAFFNMPGSASMTCAGVLGLAVAHGVANDPAIRKAQQPANLAEDKTLQKALLAIGTAVGKPGGTPPSISPDNESGKAYYYLWSLERVALALNLETIADKDWYSWGAEVLLFNQGGDGNWKGQYAEGGSDTCFALLFLRRSNLLKDISTNLTGKIKDPGNKVELRPGGVGGAAFVKAGQDLKSPFSTETKKPVDPREKNPEKPKAIPSRGEDTDEDRLCNKLLEAKGKDWERVLGEVRDTKDPKTARAALSLAIAKLEGEPRQKARDALAERMVRLKPASLEEYMTDKDAEIRRGAVIATGSKGVRTHIPLIIERLNDGDPSVVYAAAQILKHMTKQDFGPEFNASREDHDKAVKDWKNWWKDNGDK